MQFLTGSTFFYLVIGIVACLAIAALVLSKTLGLTRADRKTEGNSNSFSVRQPFSRLLTGFAFLLGGVVLFVLVDLIKTTPTLRLVTFGLALLCALIFAVTCFQYNRFRVIVRGDDALVCPTVGKRYEFHISEVKKARIVEELDDNTHYIRLRTQEGHRLKLGSRMIGYDLFKDKLGR